jgi:hypothetical protein
MIILVAAHKPRNGSSHVTLAEVTSYPHGRLKVPMAGVLKSPSWQAAHKLPSWQLTSYMPMPIHAVQYVQNLPIQVYLLEMVNIWLVVVTRGTRTLYCLDIMVVIHTPAVLFRIPATANIT